MSGIYIHIPFCKQACHYCDFHFSTALKHKNEMVQALAKEIEMRKGESEDKTIETIYFGGGTPSILQIEDFHFLIATIYKNYTVTKTPEITIEANPDDLSFEKIKQLAESPVNRLSIGIQSFFEEDLKMMNRAHNALESKKCLEIATQFFNNISIDLIYGIPNMSNQKWIQNIETALFFNIPHVSSYALTVEPKTALKKLIATGQIASPKDEVAQEQFEILIKKLEKKGFIHYETSNFSKENYFSRNNSAYWLGKNYIGIGPSAHSFNGKSRSWNINNNSLYLKSIQENNLPNQTEILTKNDLYNEFVMTGVRTIWGISLDLIKNNFGIFYLNYLTQNAQKHLNEGLLILDKNVLKTTKKGKFLSDGIASDLFIVN